jgi:glycosyltransferase involved in cell wall biosynthesis
MMIDSQKGNVVPVSVVIPCYCCADVLERAVYSVLQQSSLPEELILVDDASPDGMLTRGCISRLQYELGKTHGVNIVPVFLEVNQGPGGARNAGWDRATGKYVAFLDSDDSWHKDKLSIQVQWLDRHPDVFLCGHDLTYAELRDDSVEDSNIKSIPVSLQSMLFKNSIKTSTVILHRDMDHRFPIDIRYSEDYHLWCRMIAAGCRAVVLAVPLAKAHRPPFSDGGASADLWKMERSELRIFLDLVAGRRIGVGIGLMSALFSYMKFLRRIFLFRFR